VNKYAHRKLIDVGENSIFWCHSLHVNNLMYFFILFGAQTLYHGV